ncbi:MAG TPA: ABC transporter substrate-binding protein [Thermodesulfobacteriota bacterium]
MLTRPLLAALTLVSIAFGSTAVAQAPAGLPRDYPKEYARIIEASKKEGQLLIYSNMAAYNWKPVIDGFNKLYPWISVQTLDLGSGEVFERYYAESGSKARTADLMASGAIDRWQHFVSRGEALPYESPETRHLPKWSVPAPGLYTVSADPMVLLYNKMLVPENLRPTGMGSLAKLVASNPGRFKGKLTTYNASTEAFGLSINWAAAREQGDAFWEWLSTIGPMTRPERSAGPMIDKVTAGEYAVAYYVSGIVLFPKLDDPARQRILGWSFFDDGTPVFLRGMAIPKASTNVNAAKLMLDFILSHDGQVAFGKGGLTPYRPDVKASEVPRYTYSSVVEAIGGEDKVILVDYDPEMLEKEKAFIERWKKSFGF